MKVFQGGSLLRPVPGESQTVQVQHEALAFTTHSSVCVQVLAFTTSNDTRHLTNVERRVRKLERLLSDLFPGTDVEDLLTSPNLVQQQVSEIPRQSSMATPDPMIASESVETESQPISEALPKSYDGFDWQEEAINDADLADGMASLSIEPTGTGYLGIVYG